MRLILGTLREEQQSFASLHRMSRVWMSNLRLLITKVAREVFVFERFIAKPEEVSLCIYKIHLKMCLLDQTRSLIVQDTLVDGLRLDDLSALRGGPSCRLAGNPT